MGTRMQGTPGEDLGFPGPSNKSRFPKHFGISLYVYVSMFSTCNWWEYWNLELRR